MSNYTLSSASHEAYRSAVRSIEDAAQILRKLPVCSTGSRTEQGVWVTPFEMASRYIGLREVSGYLNHPMIMLMLKLDNSWPQNDETAWCSAFVNLICFNLGLERTCDLLARSWLNVGEIPFGLDLRVGCDIVILKQTDSAPGADVLTAPGHVGFYAGQSERADRIVVLGGNQSDSVQLSEYPKSLVLGYRRLGVA